MSKLFAVNVEVTVASILFVDADSEADAVAKLSTDAGWREATRAYGDDHVVRWGRPDARRIVRVREEPI